MKTKSGGKLTLHWNVDTLYVVLHLTCQHDWEHIPQRQRYIVPNTAPDFPLPKLFSILSGCWTTTPRTSLPTPEPRQEDLEAPAVKRNSDTKQ